MPYVDIDLSTAGADAAKFQELLEQLDENVDEAVKLAKGFATTTYGNDQLLTGSSSGQPAGLDLTDGGMPAGGKGDIVNIPAGPNGTFLGIQERALEYRSIPAARAGAQHIIGAG